MIQHPIFVLIISLLLIVFKILHSIQDGKVHKFRLSVGVLNLFFIVFIFIFYETNIISNPLYLEIYMYYTFLLYLIFVISFIILFNQAIIKTNQYHLFLRSIKDSKKNVYYVVDKRERVKDISQAFLDELEIPKDKVIGKKLFNVFNKKIRFVKLNNTEVNNKELENIYLQFRKDSKLGIVVHQELMFLNHEGNKVFLHITMQPIYSMGKYKGRLVMGEKRTDFDMLEIERELKTENKELLSIKHRFDAMLDLTDDAIYYIDLQDRTVWLSKKLQNLLGIRLEQIDLGDFRRFYHVEDLDKLQGRITDLLPNEPSYRENIRLKVNNRFTWVKDSGKRIFEDKENSIIMGAISLIPTKHFRMANIDFLDKLKDEDDLKDYLRELNKDAKYYQLSIVKLSNIPQINEEHSWAVGNLVMADYLRKLSKSFITDGDDVFRLSGLEFAVVITDTRIMSHIKQLRDEDRQFMDTVINLGAEKIKLKVNSGNSFSSDVDDVNNLLLAAKQALQFSLNPNYLEDYVYYRELT